METESKWFNLRVSSLNHPRSQETTHNIASEMLLILFRLQMYVAGWVVVVMMKINAYPPLKFFQAPFYILYIYLFA